MYISSLGDRKDDCLFNRNRRNTENVNAELLKSVLNYSDLREERNFRQLRQ